MARANLPNTGRRDPESLRRSRLSRTWKDALSDAAFVTSPFHAFGPYVYGTIRANQNDRKRHSDQPHPVRVTRQRISQEPLVRTRRHGTESLPLSIRREQPWLNAKMFRTRFSRRSRRGRRPRRRFRRRRGRGARSSGFLTQYHDVSSRYHARRRGRGAGRRSRGFTHRVLRSLLSLDPIQTTTFKASNNGSSTANLMALYGVGLYHTNQTDMPDLVNVFAWIKLAV